MIDIQRLTDRWHRLDVTIRDLPLALLLVVMSLLPTFEAYGTQVGDLTPRPHDWFTIVVVLLEALPLMVRRRFPATCVLLVSAGFFIDEVLIYHAFSGNALAIALFSAGAYVERRRQVVIALLTLMYLPLVYALDRLGSEEGVEGFVLFYLAVVLAWGMGAWLRSTRAAESERRHRIASETRTAERSRIARELHDVVTHHVTAMVVQAEAARYLTAAPERLDQALSAVTDTGRRATTDLRHLLDLLNPDHGVQSRTPTVGRFLTLVDQTRRAGQPVEFTEHGAPSESTGSADLVAYRVTQEALTNALKYAHGSRTVVNIHNGAKEIVVEVDTDRSRKRGGLVPGGGRGLAGLRERVDVLGGEFHAGPRPDGGFTVRARVPTGNPS